MSRESAIIRDYADPADKIAEMGTLDRLKLKAPLLIAEFRQRGLPPIFADMRNGVQDLGKEAFAHPMATVGILATATLLTAMSLSAIEQGDRNLAKAKTRHDVANAMSTKSGPSEDDQAALNKLVMELSEKSLANESIQVAAKE